MAPIPGTTGKAKLFFLKIGHCSLFLKVRPFLFVASTPHGQIYVMRTSEKRKKSCIQYLKIIFFF